mmetsp:Transcript_31980/g.69902  ORF Transcript_31980/g.69902 Transcript_31980/m.69902 type:complete len:201 (+) Transcript_31980:1759-2361(+)
MVEGEPKLPLQDVDSLPATFVAPCLHGFQNLVLPSPFRFKRQLLGHGEARVPSNCHTHLHHEPLAPGGDVHLFPAIMHVRDQRVQPDHQPPVLIQGPSDAQGTTLRVHQIQGQGLRTCRKARSSVDCSRLPGRQLFFPASCTRRSTASRTRVGRRGASIRVDRRGSDQNAEIQAPVNVNHWRRQWLADVHRVLSSRKLHL